MHLSSLAAWVLPIVTATGPPVGVPSTKQAAKAAASALGAPPSGGFVVVLEQLPPETLKAGRSSFQPTFELRVLYTPPGKFTIERHDLTQGTQRETRYDATATNPSLPPLWLRWLVTGAKAVKPLTTAMGLAPRTSLARAGRDVLWVWGAGPRDRSSPQLHLERDTGRIRRIIVGNDTVSFEGRAGADTPWSRRWPSVIVFGKGGAVERFRVVTVRALPAPPPPPPPGPKSSPK